MCSSDLFPSHDNNPVATFIVHEGKVYVIDKITDQMTEYHNSKAIDRNSDMIQSFLDRNEQGISQSTMIKYAQAVKTAIDKAMEEIVAELTVPK